MIFDITNLDKHLLIQTLYDHASSNGAGSGEQLARTARGENILGLTDKECDQILNYDLSSQNVRILDYCKGRPIKLVFEHRRNGNIFVDSSGYDSRNGRFRFLQALLDVFDLDEIAIKKKGYPQHLNDMINECTSIPQEELTLLKNLVKNTVKHTNNGTYWKIDTEVINYKPLFMRKI
jgi:hypothetical protein